MSSEQPKINLFEYTEEQLLVNKELTHYEILGIQEYASQDDVKKAYRKLSLKVHPDKIDDEKYHVFLAVKQAHEVLYDPIKRQAYDSTVVPFDDSIPSSREKLLQDPLLLYKDQDFYQTFGPVFQRNLRFDARLRPELDKKNNNNNSRRRQHKPSTPPTLGDEHTPIELVHKFYEYWVHFESWRDFTQQATDELQVEQHLENAESRYEKRWIQKEIDKRAKQLKTQENGRIQLLVERAMEADPRLRRERQEKIEAKERARMERQLEEERRKQALEEERILAEQNALAEKERLAQGKAAREQEKKEIRKARQVLRRMTSSSFEEEPLIWNDAYDMNVDVELLCTSLNLMELRELNDEYQTQESAQHSLKLIHSRAKELRQPKDDQDKEDFTEEKEESSDHDTKSKRPTWTNDELAFLAKGAKRFPPGGATRWDQIAQFINAKCGNHRSKEECIEKYNNIARQAKEVEKVKTAEVKTAAPDENDGEDVWTAEQDQLLQDGLSEYPATMDKNERWAAIAKCVPGKTKKQCVQRFKSIREALQSRK